MKKKTILCAIMLAAVANLGYITYDSYRTLSSAGSLVLENIEALTQTEVTKCPDPYDVPDHFIKTSSSKTESVTCSTSGSISLGGKKITGGYERGKTYSVHITNYDCIGEQNGACCRQSDVRCEITAL